MNSSFKQLISTMLRKDNPVLLYIGINVSLFVLIALTGLAIQLAGKPVSAFFIPLTEYLALPGAIASFPARFYTLFTYQFINTGFMLLLFNMLTLYWLGTIFSDFTKARQFHFVYLFGGAFGGLFFVAVCNIVPSMEQRFATSILMGSGTSVMAIGAAAATLVPDYTLRLLLIGYVRLKYLVGALLLLDILFFNSMGSDNSIAHIGGALAGFGYVKLLRSGTDLSAWMQSRTKLKVVKNSGYTSKNKEVADQKEIDAILDKISKSGYESLTKAEKARLFKASEK